MGYKPTSADYWADAVAKMPHKNLEDIVFINAVNLSEYSKDMEEAFSAAIWAAAMLRDVVTAHTQQNHRRRPG